MIVLLCASALAGGLSHLDLADAPVLSVDALGDRLAVGTRDGRVLLLDESGGIDELDVGSGHVEVDLGDGGRRVLARTGTHLLSLDTSTGRPVLRERGTRWSPPVGALADEDARWMYADEDSVRMREVHWGSVIPAWADADHMGLQGDFAWVAHGSELVLLDRDGKRGATVPLPSNPARVRATEDRLYVATWRGDLVEVDPAAGATTELTVPGFDVHEPFAVAGRRLAFPVPGNGYGDLLVVWDLDARRRVASVQLDAALMDLAFWGDRLAIVDGEQLAVWTPRGEQDAGVLAVGYAEDGAAWALHADGRARIWPQDEEPADRWIAFRPASPLAFDTRAPALLWVDARSRVQRSDLRTGDTTPGPQVDEVSALAVGQDGSFAVLGAGRVRTFTPDGAAVLDVSLSPEGVAVGPGGAYVAVLTGQSVSLVHGDGVRWTVDLGADVRAFELVGAEVVAATHRGVLRIALESPARPMDGVRHHVWAATIAGDGRAAVADGSDTLWVDGAPVVRRARTTDSREEVHLLALSPDGQWLLSADRRGTIGRWSLSEGGFEPLLGRPAALAVAAREGLVLAAYGEGTMRAYDDGAELWTTRLPSEAQDLAIAPDGRTFAAARADGTVSLHAIDGSPLRDLVSFESAAVEVAFSPDGARLAARFDTDEIVLVDLSGERIDGGRGGGLAWSPDGALVVPRAWEGVVGWTAAEGWHWVRERRRPTVGDAIATCGEAGFVLDPFLDDEPWLLKSSGRIRRIRVTVDSSPAFACDGARVAIGGWSERVTVFDLDGAVLTELRTESTPTDAAFAAPGRLVTSDLSGAVIVWDVATGEPVASYGATSAR